MAIEAARKPVTKHGDPGAGGGVDVEPFRFEARRARLDWRLLHAVDVDRMMRENDLDALESTLETVAFGDVSVEDSRNLTANNSRKILRLAQCQVEYLLHVQDTLVHHKERLRAVAERAQEDAADARAAGRDERAKAKCARAELRQARKALRTYEVLEQIRSGKPLDEILTGAILFAGGASGGAPMRLGKDSVGPSSSDDAGGLHYGGQLSALRRGAGEGADEALGSPDVLAAKAAARAMEQMREQQLAERE
eukprot:CAMPEP_0181395378 /NCGR_PEP_ID=MMETSP1106-20121128/28308_1 /TAXON_ID=81844 /ORGANISM="Mantoniella antarctica, Strain SL-175" /LENGTH=251 /DNA_ID=CAMNT_0023516995 /DNA_START=126 /DNA_END=878 /DNA_ORIENTATION=+